jgi:hypothetical protein
VRKILYVIFAIAARSIHDKLLIAISESRKPRQNLARYPVNAGLFIFLMRLPAALRWSAQ